MHAKQHQSLYVKLRVLAWYWLSMLDLEAHRQAGAYVHPLPAGAPAVWLAVIIHAHQLCVKLRVPVDGIRPNTRLAHIRAARLLLCCVQSLWGCRTACKWSDFTQGSSSFIEQNGVSPVGEVPQSWDLAAATGVPGSRLYLMFLPPQSSIFYMYHITWEERTRTLLLFQAWMDISHVAGPNQDFSCTGKSCG